MSIDCLFYWSIFPIIYYVWLHTLKFFKSAWNLSFVVKNEENLASYFCWHMNCTFLLFHACARLWQHTRIQEIFCWEGVKEAILVSICPIKPNVFVVISEQMIPLLWHVWYKDTVQVSDGFVNKRGVLIYHIKLQCMHVCKSNFGISLLGLWGRGLLDNARVSNLKNYQVLDKDIHPRYTPLATTVYDFLHSHHQSNNCLWLFHIYITIATVCDSPTFTSPK